MASSAPEDIGQHVLVLCLDELRMVDTGEVYISLIMQGKIHATMDEAKALLRFKHQIECDFIQADKKIRIFPEERMIVPEYFIITIVGEPGVRSGSGGEDICFQHSTVKNFAEFKSDLKMLLAQNLIPSLEYHPVREFVFRGQGAIIKMPVILYPGAGTPGLNHYAFVGVVRQPNSGVTDAQLLGYLFADFLTAAKTAINSQKRFLEKSIFGSKS